MQKINFYAVLQSDVQVGITENVDVTLSHQQAAREIVNVQESAPSIDPAQISMKEELTGSEIVDIPYPGTHDYRNALTFIPGVTPDAFGQAHFAGSEVYQTLVLLDGFNVTQPANGQLAVRTSIESFHSIEVTPSREPAEFGKGSGGVLALNTRMGDDHFHFTITDFIPGLQDIKGFRFGQWNPIYTMSGPIRKGRCGLSMRSAASMTTTSPSNYRLAPMPIILARGQSGKVAIEPDRSQHCDGQLLIKLLSRSI